MNEKFKTLIIVALCLMLLGIALHLLFVQHLKSRLIAEQVDYELAEFSENNSASETAEIDAQPDEQLMLKLENRLTLVTVFKFIFILTGAVLFIIAWFFRDKKRDEFDDEWEDGEDWEDGRA